MRGIPCGRQFSSLGPRATEDHEQQGAKNRRNDRRDQSPGPLCRTCRTCGFKHDISRHGLTGNHPDCLFRPGISLFCSGERVVAGRNVCERNRRDARISSIEHEPATARARGDTERTRGRDQAHIDLRTQACLHRNRQCLLCVPETGECHIIGPWFQTFKDQRGLAPVVPFQYNRCPVRSGGKEKGSGLTGLLVRIIPGSGSGGKNGRGAMGRRFDLSVSWKRALGTSAARGRVTRSIGIPKTRSAQDWNLRG